MFPEALFRLWCREISQRKSWNIHKGNATGWPFKAAKEIVSPTAVTWGQRTANKNKSFFSSVQIEMSMTAISKNCPWEWIEKTVGPLLSYGCILPDTIPKHSYVSSCLSQKLFL